MNMLINSVNNSSKMPAFTGKRADVYDSSLNSQKHAGSRSDLKEFASLNDEELNYIASFEPNRKLHHTKAGLLNTLFFVLPAADVGITAIAKNSNLSGKLSAGAKQAGRWAGVFAIGALVLGGVKRIVNKNVPALDNADKKHPVLGFAADFSAMFAGLVGLKALGSSASKLINKNFPKQTAFLQNKVKTPLKNALNNSAFNTKLVQPLNERAFSSVNGWGRSLKITEAFLAPVILTAAIFKGISSLRHNEKEARENFAVLKTVQNMAKISLASNSEE